MMRRGRRRLDDNQVKQSNDRDDAVDEREGSLPAIANEIRQLHQSIGNSGLGRLLQAQREAEGEGLTPVSPAVQRSISAQRGNGERLDGQTRVEMEDRLGRSLPDVRVHADAASDTMARQLDAEAFTQGRDIFLRPTSPLHSPAGQETIAHELVHAAEGRARPGFVQRKTALPSPVSPYEEPKTDDKANGQAAPTTEQPKAAEQPKAEAAPAAPASAMQTMWDLSVLRPLNNAAQALKNPDAEGIAVESAILNLTSARTVIDNLESSYRDRGEDDAADSMEFLSVSVLTIIRSLRPHDQRQTGIKSLTRELTETIPEYAAEIRRTLARPAIPQRDAVEAGLHDDVQIVDEDEEEETPAGDTPLQMMWDINVTQHIVAAGNLIQQEDSLVDEVLAQVFLARESVESMVGSAHERGEITGRFAFLFHQLQAVERALEGRAGIVTDVSIVAERLQSVIDATAADARKSLK